MARWDAGWHRRLQALIADLAFRPIHDQAPIRRALARDPVAFAILYLRHHLKDRDGNMSFSEAHYAWASHALTWADGPPVRPMQDRHAFIAPRECGKSTWWFLILPLWAAANGHVRFAAAFAHSASQAELHLKTFRAELDNNALLRYDYPDLCQSKRKPSSGATVSDNAGMLVQRSGFVFAARGADSATLGMKVGPFRPDLLLLDDVEPDEASYSKDLAVKRLGTIVDAIFPLNVYARVVMAGTVTMPGSIIHQLVKAAAGQEAEPWVAEQEIQAHHIHPIIRDDDGVERSVWPEKWPLDFLNKIRHTRAYAKNYDNDPMSREGMYWLKQDFRYGRLDAPTRCMLVVDPAVTARKTSDYTGLAVVRWQGPELLNGSRVPTKQRPGTCEITWSIGVKLTGAPLRQYVAEQVLPRFENIRYILVETNQGGDLWAATGGVLHGLGVRVGTHWASESKEVRFGRELDHWQRGRVLHAVAMPMMEEQAIGFPRHAYDDVIDAAVAGVHYFLTRPYKTTKVTERSEVYV